jgi:hypothetical protein
MDKESQPYKIYHHYKKLGHDEDGFWELHQVDSYVRKTFFLTQVDKQKKLDRAKETDDKLATMAKSQPQSDVD